MTILFTVARWFGRLAEWFDRTDVADRDLAGRWDL